MRRSTLLFLVLAATLALPGVAGPSRRQAAPRPGPALAPGDTVPEVAGYGLDGRQSVVSYAGAKLTVVNFWATWCIPCREEMPALEKIHKAHPEAGLQVVGALINDPATVEQVQAALTETGASYRVVALPEGAGHAWGGITLVPTTFLINRDGKLVRKFVGTDEAAVKAMAKDVDDYLAGRPLGNPYVPKSTQ